MVIDNFGLGGDNMELAQRLLDLIAEGRLIVHAELFADVTMANRRSPLANLQDTAEGLGAMNRHGSRVELDPYMLAALIYLAENNVAGVMTINTMAGTTGHVGGATDPHALGFAVDIQGANYTVNGVANTVIVQRLLDAGFILYRGYEGYLGMHHHLHLSVWNGR